SFSVEIFRPDDAIAICAAPIAYCVNGSIFLMSRRSMKSSGAKSRTSPAMRDGKSDAGKRVIGPTPERPAINADQFFSTPVPRGVTSPTPVTTTRRRPPFCTSFPTEHAMVGRAPEGVKVTQRARYRGQISWRSAWPILAVFVIGVAVYANTLGH